MPIHDYLCLNCGHKAEEYHKGEAPQIEECPRCKTPNYRKQLSLIHAPQLGYAVPIVMNSCAVNTIEDIRRLQRLCPDAEIADCDYDDPLWGIPVARSRTAKLQVLKASGQVEKDR